MNRHGRLQFESLESRLALSVTADAPGNHVVPDGQWTGVLLNRNTFSGETYGSVLLPTGRHVLTAAHPLKNDPLVNHDVRIVDLPGEVNDVFVDVVGVYQYPEYNVNLNGTSA
jgi:hypothetical protein